MASLNSELLKSYENEWKKLDKKDKLIQLGKLKMIDEIKEYLECYAESIVRELRINNCTSEEDCLEGKELEKNKEYQDPQIISVKSI